MTKAEEIYQRHYQEKFRYMYKNNKEMARHLKQIAIDTINEALKIKKP